MHPAAGFIPRQQQRSELDLEPFNKTNDATSCAPLNTVSVYLSSLPPAPSKEK